MKYIPEETSERVKNGCSRSMRKMLREHLLFAVKVFDILKILDISL